MNPSEKSTITVRANILATPDKVWELWTLPEHIMQWNHASDDWHTPHAENDLQAGGKFKTTMAAKDGSMSFDLEGVYTYIEPYKIIEYSIIDGRKVKITFSNQHDQTKVVETFETENENPPELQRGGWQAILHNFKKYTEAN